VFTLQSACSRGHIPPRSKLRAWAEAAAARKARVTMRIVGGREGRSLNRRFRGRDRATNVLTFVYEEKPLLYGDIALCAPVIEREARAGGIPLEAHYAHLVVHGMLHLQGYDHARGRDARIMEAREVAILGRLGYPDPYRGTA
jgi:probable rRNA maturation factor